MQQEGHNLLLYIVLLFRINEAVKIICERLSGTEALSLYRNGPMLKRKLTFKCVRNNLLTETFFQ